MHRPMLRALKLAAMHGIRHELSLSDASPDVEGIETPRVPGALLGRSVRCIARC